MQTMPMPGFVLVKLPVSDLGNIPVSQQSHETLMSGEVIQINPDHVKSDEDLIGKTAYWGKFKSVALIVGSKEKLGFIEIKDIMGYTYASNS